MSARARIPGPLIAGTTAPLPAAAAHHLTTVLRLGEGDPVRVYDGSGQEADATLARTSTGWSVTIGAIEAGRTAAALTLCYGLAKGDKVDQVVRQATELGVQRIVLVACARSVLRLSGERQTKRVARWRRVAEAAARQCGRADAIELSGPMDLGAALALTMGSTQRLFHPGGAPLSEAEWTGPAAVFVGPEGGFSDDELRLAEAAGAGVVGLDTPVLRSETAALVACAVTLASLKAL